MKVGVPRAYLAYSVLAHQNRRVGIVQNVSGQVRNLSQDPFGNIGRT